jgi:hypothetical protein
VVIVQLQLMNIIQKGGIKMADYSVEFTATWSVDIEANSEEEACCEAWTSETKFLKKHFSLSHLNTEVEAREVS